MIITCAFILQNGILSELEDGKIDNQHSHLFSVIMFFLIPVFIFSGIGIIVTNSSKSVMSLVINSPILYLGLTYVL